MEDVMDPRSVKSVGGVSSVSAARPTRVVKRDYQESKPVPTGFRDAPDARPRTCTGVRHRKHFRNCRFLRRS